MKPVSVGADDSSLRLWIDRLKDRHPARRVYAAVVLAAIGPRAKSAVTALAEALRDSVPEVRRRAALALGEMGAEARAAVPALCQAAMRDVNDLVRMHAIQTLGEIGAGAGGAVPALVEVLRTDGSSDVRRWAAAALGEIGPTGGNAVHALIDAFLEQDVRNRVTAAAALRKFGDGAVPQLVDALYHDHPLVRRYAVRTLAKGFRNPDEAPLAVWDLLDDPEAEVREAAEEVLCRCGGKGEACA